jgi:hypothetical protein
MSVAATGTDFAVFYSLLHLGLASPLAAGLGCSFGAVVGFSLGYRWAFEPSIGMANAAVRYVFVSVISAFAVVTGMTVCARNVPWPPTWSWVIVRVTVYLAVTFPLFRYWAFESRKRHGESD